MPAIVVPEMRLMVPDVLRMPPAALRSRRRPCAVLSAMVQLVMWSVVPLSFMTPPPSSEAVLSETVELSSDRSLPT